MDFMPAKFWLLFSIYSRKALLLPHRGEYLRFYAPDLIWLVVGKKNELFIHAVLQGRLVFLTSIMGLFSERGMRRPPTYWTLLRVPTLESPASKPILPESTNRGGRRFIPLRAQI